MDRSGPDGADGGRTDVMTPLMRVAIAVAVLSWGAAVGNLALIQQNPNDGEPALRGPIGAPVAIGNQVRKTCRGPC